MIRGILASICLIAVSAGSFSKETTDLAAPEARAAGFPEMHEGMCGPATAFHTYLEGAGFRLEQTMTTITSDHKARMTYLATVGRAKARKAEDVAFGIPDSFLEIVIVMHEDANAKRPKGWRCISDVTSMTPADRRALTGYFNEISKVFD